MVSLPFPGATWVGWSKLHEQGWAVVCVRSVFAGQASLSTCCVYPAKQINVRLYASDCCDSVWASTIPTSPRYPEKYFTTEEQVKHKWDCNFWSQWIRLQKTKESFFAPKSTEIQSQDTGSKSQCIAHRKVKPRLRSHRGPNPTLQRITCFLTDSVFLNYCRKYVASYLPFSARTQEI